MAPLRPLALTAGRALALLAVLMLVLVPASPGHAHLQGHVAAGASHAHHADSAGATTADRAADHEHGLPQGTCDCCSLCHVSMISAASAVPLPATMVGERLIARERNAPPDAPAEALPEPPRPTA